MRSFDKNAAESSVIVLQRREYQELPAWKQSHSSLKATPIAEITS
jgi:hypothetical protein